MNDEAPLQFLPALRLEYVDPDLLGVELGPSGPIATDLMKKCVAIFAWAGVDPQETRLVLTGDLVQSVRDRGDSEYHANYSTRRNAGSVTGKTIPMPDGTIDVLIWAGLFMVERNEDEAAEAATLAVRAVLHEGQHVVIHQAGEAQSSFSEQEGARRDFLTIAKEVIEEYRAEAVCARVVGGSGWSAYLPTALETWLGDLQRIACEEYQNHLDVDRLYYGVIQETQTAWKLLAYVAAELADGSDLPSTATTHVLWQDMVEPHWDSFLAILSNVPDGQQRVPLDDLNAFTSALADELADWLLTLGFESSDNSEGSAFWIRDWSLLAPNAS